MRWKVAIVAGVATMSMGTAVSAQSVEPLPLTVTATCDGVITARYDYEIGLGNDLTDGVATFTGGAVTDTQPLTDVPNGSSGPQSETLTSSGWAVGDLVQVEFAFTFTSDGSALGTATVEIPECIDPPVVTDPPTTDAPVTTDATTTTTQPGVVATAPPATLPSTGRSAQTEAVAGAGVLALGVGLVLVARRRRRAL